MGARKTEVSNRLLTDKEFDEIRDFFSKLTGNKLGSDKRQLVESRLRKKFLNSKIEVKQYIKMIQTDLKEQSDFISSLTTHKTDWFRESQHFEFLKKQILQAQKNSKHNEWKIWSAACSTGEEIYTLLMILNELGEKNIRLLGTDISESCIKSGSEGIYNLDVVNRQVPPNLIQKYFVRGVGEKSNEYYKFDPSFKNLIKWRQFNLINSELNAKVMFDYIFLRNVLIYFDAETGFQIAKRLLNYLKPGGHFIIGLSETVMNPEDLGLKRVENSVYRKS